MFNDVDIGNVSNRPCRTSVTMMPCRDLMGLLCVMLIRSGIDSPLKHPAFKSSMVAETPLLSFFLVDLLIDIEPGLSRLGASSGGICDVEELGDMVSLLPIFDSARSSVEPCALFARARFPDSSGIILGFGAGYAAMSISSTSESLCSHTRVGDLVAGRVNVADIVYDMDPFSNYASPRSLHQSFAEQ